jgi:hypothetical protein
MTNTAAHQRRRSRRSRRCPAIKNVKTAVTAARSTEGARTSAKACAIPERAEPPTSTPARTPCACLASSEIRRSVNQ